MQNANTDPAGGGIYCYESNPNLTNVTISRNMGNGLFCELSSPRFDQVNRCNIYLNQAIYGRDLYAWFDTLITTIQVVVDTFTVMQPNDLHAYPGSHFTFDILASKLEQVNADLYVSPTGDNTNSGLTSADPLKTIDHALSIILADSLNPRTIRLANGTYGPSTSGEHFPIRMFSYVSLSGESEAGVILDAEQLSQVMLINNACGITVQNLTITGGMTESGWRGSSPGGGIYCDNSNPQLMNVTLKGNAPNGMICWGPSSPYLENVTSIQNDEEGLIFFESSPSLVNVVASENGCCGIHCDASSLSLMNVIASKNRMYGFDCYYSSPSLVNVVLSENGEFGLYCYDSSPSLVNVTVSRNISTEYGGGIHCYESSPSVVNSIIWNNTPEEIYIETGSVSATYSNIRGGWTGDGNINANPLFVDADNGDYRLSDYSTCIGAGTLSGAPPTDIEGNPRPDPPGSNPDIGAYENSRGDPLLEPQIYTGVDSLDFGQVFVDYADSLELIVENKGSLDLLITSVATDPTEYTIVPSSAGIDPGEMEVFRVTFAPEAVADYPGNLTFTSNDPDEGTLTIPLVGWGALPPIISASPDSLSTELNTGETTTQTLTITNTGASDLAGDLTFNMSADYLAGPGGHNYALQFDGLDDYVDCGDLGFGSSVTDITVAMWIKPNSITADDGGWEFGGVPPEEFSLGIWDGLYHTKTNGQWFNYNAKDAGEWAHVVVTYDGSMHKIYLDGALHGSNPYSESIDLLGRPFIIGTYDNREYYADGAIDEVSVWNVARTETEIQEDMNRQLTGLEPGLVGYWRYNDSSGDIAYDSSPNGNHGTLEGGASWVVSSAPVATWLTITPISGIVEPGTSLDINVTFDATTLLGGSYLSVIRIVSNDPATPLITIPASLTAISVGTIEDQTLPQAFALHQNYPNPFNPVSTIRYDLPQASDVSLILYDILGREVVRLVEDHMGLGYHQTQWNGRNRSGREVPTGIYIARLVTPEYTKSIKMVLLK